MHRFDFKSKYSFYPEMGATPVAQQRDLERRCQRPACPSLTFVGLHRRFLFVAEDGRERQEGDRKDGDQKTATFSRHVGEMHCAQDDHTTVRGETGARRTPGQVQTHRSVRQKQSSPPSCQTLSYLDRFEIII